MNFINKYKYLFFGILGGVVWAFYTLCINRYYQSEIFNTYWYSDNLKELFSESIINNIICVLSAFGIGTFIWTKVKKQKLKDFVVKGKRLWIVVLINGLLSGTGATILYHLSVQFSGEVYASCVTTMYIPLSSIYSWMVFKKVNWKSIVGVGLVTASLITISFLDPNTESVKSLLIGIGASSLVGLCWALEAILNFYFLNNDNEKQTDPSIFIAYRQLISLVGLIVIAYITYPILSHQDFIGSKLHDKTFQFDWVISMLMDSKTIIWLIVGSLFNSISDFTYYWSSEGLAVPSATTLNNLDTPTGLFLTLFIVIFNLSGIFGEQTIPSFLGMLLIFLVLFGSSIIVYFDDNKILEENEQNNIVMKNKNFNFLTANLFLVSLFSICSILAYIRPFNLKSWKQEQISVQINEQVVKKYEPRETTKVFKSVINEYKADQ